MHEEFILIDHGAGAAKWCNGEHHVELAGLRDAHDFRSAAVKLIHCSCLRPAPQTPEDFEKL